MLSGEVTTLLLPDTGTNECENIPTGRLFHRVAALQYIHYFVEHRKWKFAMEVCKLIVYMQSNFVPLRGDPSSSSRYFKRPTFL